MKTSRKELAQYLLSRHQSMKNDRAPWDTLWRDIADYVMPRKADVLKRETSASGTRYHDGLFDTTAIFANQTLANGQLAYMTPSESRWFAYNAPQVGGASDAAAAWFQQCTDLTQLALAGSNFYSEIHELYFDDGAFGTSAIFVKEGRQNALNFTTFNIGSYCLAEDDEGLVDTCFRELHLTCRQAALQFGEENLSEKLRKELADYCAKGEAGQIKHGFLHAIYPRDQAERERGKQDGGNKPFASVYLEMATRHVVSVGGFDEKPFFATRHLKCGDAVYGISPSWMALPDARQINFLTKQLDALAEIKAFPRILAPDSHEGGYNLDAGGITYFDPNQPSQVPREWATAGDYAAGLDREKRKQASIERAYHVDLFNMFAQLDKQMTAREVAERSAEKLIQFTPAFARKTTELFTPLLRRIFGLQLRAGHFPPPPPDVVQRDPHTGEPFIAEPSIAYLSKVALAINAQHNSSFARTMEMVQPLIPIRPDILDNFDFDVISREGARNDGLPANWMVPMDKVQELREARQQAQAQAAQQQAALSAADAAGKVGRIPNDSPVGQALQGALK